MTIDERSEIRDIQDEFIRLVEKQGATDDDLVLEDFNKTTLGDLKKYVYPQYESIFRGYIEDY